MKTPGSVHTALAVACLSSAGLLPVQAHDDRPNIVFLMADDHQALALGCMGNLEIHTPHLDRLAADGVVFDRCYANTAICMGSRCSVMTGAYEYRTGCNFQTGEAGGHGPISREMWQRLAYPVLLRGAGYRVGFAGKWGFNVADHEWPGDFDNWGGFAGSGQGSYDTMRNASLASYANGYPHVTRALGAFGRDFIRESATDVRPFCLSISFKAPHLPHDNIDPADQPLYAGTTFSLPDNYGREIGDRLSIQPRLSRHQFRWPSWGPDQYQQHLRQYYRLISGIDTAVGMVLAELEAAGVDDETVVIYTSDNGYFCGAHGLEGKVLPYEESSRIPLIVSHPEMRESAGSRCGAVVGNIDFAPTLLDLAGVPIPDEMDGLSLLPLLVNPAERIRDSMLLIQNWGWAGTEHSKALGVVTEDWKYIHWCYADENVPPAEELYWNANDPLELDNLIDEAAHIEILDELRRQYDMYLGGWRGNMIDRGGYAAQADLFDRRIPWREKEFTPLSQGPRRNSAANSIAEIYRELTGENPARRLE